MMGVNVGELYQMSGVQAAGALSIMGRGRVMLKGVPDLTRGRRYLGQDTWEFWMTSGQKVTICFVQNGGFLSSVSRDADRERPKPQFPYEPTVCIKPECNNLVAPISTKPAEGHFKNYRATGACQQGHNIYSCSKCGTAHSYTTKIGIAHMEYRHND